MTQIGKCGTLLIVEDNEALLETYRDLLELEGYEVVTATNGQEALKALEIIKHPCLILLDMFMPIMDGWEFLDQLKLRSEDLITSLPIVICSAAGASAEETSKQVRGYIRKPADIDLLLDTVKKFCRPPVAND